MKQSKIKCENCGKEFYRCDKEVKRNEKIGRRTFCSLSCSSSKITTEQYEQGSRVACISNIPLEKRIIKKRDELSDFRYFFKRVKTRCAEFPEKKEISISASDLKNLWDSQHGVCPYLKIKMLLPRESGNPLKKASIDRIDSSKGYSIDNIEFVCRGVNFAKNKYSKYDVVEFFNEIASQKQNSP